jgi:hypothetical protein
MWASEKSKIYIYVYIYIYFFPDLEDLVTKRGVKKQRKKKRDY